MLLDTCLDPVCLETVLVELGGVDSAVDDEAGVVSQLFWGGVGVVEIAFLLRIQFADALYVHLLGLGG